MTKELDYKSLGQRIRQARKSQNLSQEQLSELVGISPNYLSKIETNNGGVVSLPTLVKISNALSISMDYLLIESLNLKEDDLLNLNILTDDDKIYIQSIIREFLIYKKKILITLN